MRLSCLKYVGLLLLLTPQLLLSQGQIPTQRFRVLGLESGLPHLTVGDISQDERGFIWVGTSNGLARFDGHGFRVSDPQTHPGELLSGLISGLQTDGKGHLWLGTRGAGLYRYREWEDQFDRYRPVSDSISLPNDYVNQILWQEKTDVLWVATDVGLGKIDLTSQTPEFVPPFAPETEPLIKGMGVQCLSNAADGGLWIGLSKGGLYHLSQQQELTGPFQGIPSPRIKSIWLDTLSHQPRLWVGHVRGLTCLQLENGEWQPSSSPITGTQVNKLIPDEKGRLWVATYGRGLAVLDPQHPDAQQWFQHAPNQPGSLPTDRLHDLFFDREGSLWIGTEGEGLVQFPMRHAEQTSQFFRLLHRPIVQVGDSPTQVITALHEDQNGRIWMGSEGGGLDVYSPEMELIMRLGAGKGPHGNLSHSIVTTLAEEAGTMWIGTFGGLHRIRHTGSPDDWHLENWPPADGPELSDVHVFAIYPASDGAVWVGTRGGGLNRVDSETGEVEVFQHDVDNPSSLPNNYVWDIISDGKGGLWLATDGGLCHFDPATNEFQTISYDPSDPQSLTTNYLNVLLLDSQERLWIGTYGGGLMCYSEEGICSIRTRDGLPSEIVYGILEDEGGNLWISTEYGLVRFDPEETGSRAFSTFFEADGLPANEFNSNAFCRGGDGRFYFGGMQGMVHFRPDEMPEPDAKPAVQITRLLWYNQELKPGEEVEGRKPLLTQPMHLTEEIHLDWRDDVIAFEFSDLSFVFPEKARFAYKLEGFDRDWLYCGEDRMAHYTDLPQGDYILKVRAVRDDAVEANASASLHIEVGAPPWLRWWAILMYAVVAGGLVWALIRRREERQKQEWQTQMRIREAKAEEREAIRKRTAADFHDELGNKITKINLFLELARRHVDQPAVLRNYLSQVDGQAQRLSDGMRDLIWMLDPEKDQLEDTLLHLKDFGDQLFEHTDITFRTEGLQADNLHGNLPPQLRRNLVMMVKEAMHNALKYAQASEVMLSIQKMGENLELTVSDNGQGFDPVTAKQGYGLRNLRQRSATIGADFRLDAAPGQGTKIHISLPLPHMRD